jgi:hypothetical protein
MKANLLASVALLTLIFVGCSEIPQEDLNYKSEKSFIPINSGSQSVNSVETEFSSSKDITGSCGGVIEIDEVIPGGPFGEIKVKAKMKVKAGTFPDNETINFTLTVNTENTTVIVYPVRPDFTKPIQLSVEYKGLDLSGVNPEEVQFIFEDGNGNYYQVENDEVFVKISQGKLRVKNAKITNEFVSSPMPYSRFGFIR